MTKKLYQKFDNQPEYKPQNDKDVGTVKRRITQSLSCLLILMLTIILNGCSLLPIEQLNRAVQPDEPPTPTPIPTSVALIKPTYDVQRGEIVKETNFSGRISPVIEEDLFFESNGRIENLYFKRNDIVVTGDLIAEYSVEDIRRELENAQLTLEQEQSRLGEAEQGLDYDRRVAQANLEIAELQLQSLQEGGASEVDVAIQEKRVELAQIAVERMDGVVDTLLENNVNRAQLAVEKLETEISEARITAPFDGQLLSVALSPGQTIEAYSPIAVLADVTELEVKADLTSSQLEDLVEGMNVSVVLVSRPGEILTGEIRRLPYPYGSGGRGTTVEDQDKSTRITVDLADQDGFEMGDLVRATVELERREDTLWLPPQALRTFDGRRFATVRDGEAESRVDVKVGIITSERVEILEGLEQGQTVVGQ